MVGIRVVDERWIHRSAVFVEDDLLAERLADAHCGGAFDLAFGGGSVDRLADVVDGDVFQDLHVAGVRTHLDDAGMGSKRLGAAVGFFFSHQFQIVAVTAADDFADDVVRVGGDGGERDRLRRRAFDADLLVDDLEIVRARFQFARGHFENLIARVDGCEPRSRRRKPGCPGCRPCLRPTGWRRCRH